MFGVTTPLVTQLVDALADRYDPLVFHATGTGGRSMEKLVESGLVTAVLDMTTTEIADHVVGGVFPAGPDRIDVIARTGVPYVGSCGALDMVNFGARATVPERFTGRLLHVHNAEVTLMRTTVDENMAVGEFIARQAQRLRWPGALLAARGWRVAARRARAAVLGSRRRCGAVHHDRGAGGHDGDAAGRTGAAEHQRPRVRGGGAGRVRGGHRLMTGAAHPHGAAGPVQRPDRSAHPRSSAAGPAPGCRRSGRKPAASTSS